jgi:hypothetical protein
MERRRKRRCPGPQPSGSYGGKKIVRVSYSSFDINDVAKIEPPF